MQEQDKPSRWPDILLAAGLISAPFLLIALAKHFGWWWSQGNMLIVLLVVAGPLGLAILAKTLFLALRRSRSATLSAVVTAAIIAAISAAAVAALGPETGLIVVLAAGVSSCLIEGFPPLQRFSMLGTVDPEARKRQGWQSWL